MEIGRNPEAASKMLKDVCETRLTGNIIKDAAGNYVCDLSQKRCRDVVERGEQFTECTADPAQVFNKMVEVRQKFPPAPVEVDATVRFPSGEFTIPTSEATIEAWKKTAKPKKQCIEREEFDRCFYEKI